MIKDHILRTCINFMPMGDACLRIVHKNFWPKYGLSQYYEHYVDVI